MQPLLIDDFRHADGLSALGTRWQSFTDRVMGGRSEMEVTYKDTAAGPVLNMRGRVTLENRGGFIQVRLPLRPDGGVFDARGWHGIAIELRASSWLDHWRGSHEEGNG